MTPVSAVAVLDAHRQVSPDAQPHPAPLLSVDGLTIVTDQDVTLVRDLSFDLPKGGAIGIVGESGSGKSLTCRAILGLLPPGLAISSGSIRHRDKDLLALDRRGWQALHGIELSAVFQDPASYLNPSIPVGRQLAEALRATRRLGRTEAREQALNLLRRVGLGNAEAVYGQYPFELSGGMAQRVLIAIAVSAGPRILIADEATTAIDGTVQAEVLALLDRLRREEGLSLILVSHDLAVVSSVCETVIVMQDGVVVEAGRTADVLQRPQHNYSRSLIDNHSRYTIDTLRTGGEQQPVTAAPILRIENLRAAYGNRAVLDGIDLHVDRGEILGLIGETGCGKTTILRAILGVVAPHDGRILLEGEDISRLRGRALQRFRRKSPIQHVFQDPLRSLDPDRTIGESIGEGLAIRGVDRGERHARLLAALAQVDLAPDLIDRLPKDLSGGQRQRAVLARALILEPQLLLLDEPVSALDAVNRIHVLELMRRLADQRGIAQVFISHDLGSIAGITDRLAVLHEGRIVEIGDTSSLITSPRHPYTRRLLASVLRLEPRDADRDPAPAEA